MKTVSKIIYVLCIIINSSCEDISDFDPGESKPVVEAFIYEGESVDDIYLKKQYPLIMRVNLVLRLSVMQLLQFLGTVRILF